MGFLKNFVCRGCGSSLGKSRMLPSGLRTVWCFTCCAGDFMLMNHEMQDMDTEEVASLAGREWGSCKSIHRRLNTPGEKQAFRPSADHVKWQLYERNERSNNYVPTGKVYRDPKADTEQRTGDTRLLKSENTGGS